MARKALGNDPFARGAAPRVALPVVPADSARPERTAVLKQPKVQSTGPADALAPRVQPSPRREPAPPLVRSPPSPAERAARELLETTAERLRRFVEQRLPELVEGMIRSSIDALGLAAQPIPVSDVDAFGMSLEFVERWQPVLARVLRSYFRADLLGMEKLPATAPAILVCNHSGILPYDELLLKVAVSEGHPLHRDVRPLSEDFAINSPFAGSWLNRFGLVRASQDNATRLLQSGSLVAAFPEGSQGMGKLFPKRYKLQRFGRGGVVRLALRTGVPIYPVALIGGEEAQAVVARVALPRPFKPAVLPLTATFPWLGPLGLLPLPTRWIVEIGEPIVLGERPEAAEDRALVARLSEEVRATLQRLIDGRVAARGSVF